MQALARKFQADIAIDRTGNIGRIKTRKPALNLASPSSNG
jgi:hypothetical protein